MVGDADVPGGLGFLQADLLPEEAVFDDVIVKVLFSLQEQGAGTTGRVVDFIDRFLLVHGKLCDQFGHMLRGKKLAA